MGAAVAAQVKADHQREARLAHWAQLQKDMTGTSLARARAHDAFRTREEAFAAVAQNGSLLKSKETARACICYSKIV